MAGRSQIRAGAAFVELKSKDADFIRGMRRAQRRLEAFGAAAKRIGVSLIAGGGSVVAAAGIAARAFSKMGDQLDKMSKRTGVSVESLSALGFAAEQSGANIETLEKGIRSMQRSIYDANRGLSTQIDALDKLGLKASELEGLSPEEQFTLLAQRISEVEDPTTRAAVAMSLFGRSGQQLLPLLSEGASGIAELRRQAESFGLVISTEAAASAAELTDTLNIGRRVIKALTFEVGGALAPAIIKSTKATTAIVRESLLWVRNNGDLIRTVALVAGGTVALGTIIVGVGIAAQVAAFSIGGLATVVGVMGATVAVAGSLLAALLSPLALVSVAVIGLGSLILSQSQEVRNVVAVIVNLFQGMAGDVFDVLGSISSAILAGDLELAVKIAGKGIELAWNGLVVNLKTAWLDFISFVARTAFELPKKINGALYGLEVGLGVLLGKGGSFTGKIPRLPDVSGAGQLVTETNNARIVELNEQLDKLRRELEDLEGEAPENLFSGLGNFSSALAGLQLGQAEQQVRRSAQGVFQTNTLRNLATPEEKSIESNTQEIVDLVNQAVSLLRRGVGGGLIVL